RAVGYSTHAAGRNPPAPGGTAGSHGGGSCLSGCGQCVRGLVSRAGGACCYSCSALFLRQACVGPASRCTLAPFAAGAPLLRVTRCRTQPSGRMGPGRTSTSSSAIWRPKPLIKLVLDTPGGSLLAHRPADPGAILPAQLLADPVTDRDQRAQIHAGADAHAVEHVEHVLTGHITAGALGVGAAAESGNRAVEYADALQQSRMDIDQRLAIGVVEVAGQLASGYPLT